MCKDDGGEAVEALGFLQTEAERVDLHFNGIQRVALGPPRGT